MTVVEFFKSTSGNILKVKSTGHAGYGTSGNDIVCAAISAIIGATRLGLQDVVNVNINYIECDIKGMCEITLPKSLNNELMNSAQLLLKTMYVSLVDLEKQYGKFLKIKELQL